ncbi:glycosyltransferase family 4 protein [Gemmata sp. JC717]|uniref:glycosyltransferase family 4 protein n=1 Tax=Gemmata algarum TaxID=2975278 RepID=UPI0021BB7A46|nr:glycosyltransferase family 4 protein [Gemmata algarum]MDY3556688.1 glycosyltransferase family 4 protein [Gemmata algarum]
MRVTIYQEPAGAGIGGSELVVATMATALRERHTVRILHHHQALTRARLEAFSGCELDGVELRQLPPVTEGWFPAGASVRGLRAGYRAWKAGAVRGCDLFVTSTHNLPPFCPDVPGVLYVLFPGPDRAKFWPWNAPPARGLGAVKQRVVRLLHDRMWRERFAGYPVRLADSQFSVDWTQQYWGVAADVLYPPVVLPERAPAPKQNRIVVLGRFAPNKRQADLVRLFRERVAPRLPEWELVCVGSAGTSESDRAYFEHARVEAGGAPVRFVTDATREQLTAELAAAKLFWHATGLGIDARADPFAVEHFGIATVEAMAAGCVPLVPDRGGQPEIVRHGTDGFLCGAVSELGDRAIELAGDEPLRERLARSAWARAEEFGRERFVSRFRALLRPLTGDS